MIKILPEVPAFAMQLHLEQLECLQLQDQPAVEIGVATIKVLASVYYVPAC